ncbi:MAG: 16S rRNA (cytosine(1402)-N(4))-methyltransferase RsmH [Proteobacteria bacterium]|nr:16S rRNA (cytosine(1402)-N(4))-methyltransferase RsmH [Pseudomonadota bacterium]
MSSNFKHEPVLLVESLDQLALSPGAVVVDGTVGGGGHAAAILERTAPTGHLIGLDRDADALEAARTRLAPFAERAHLAQESFRDLARVVRDLDFAPVDGVLLDLGVSSHQLDRAARGFRFGAETAADTPLDMRMDTSGGETAAELVARATVEQLEEWFRAYGELPGARRLARAIVAARDERPIATAANLVDVIERAGIGRGRRHHPATLVFQALRIAVNDELEALERGLEGAAQILRPGGRLVVIAYHSLEDRIVKHRLREGARSCTCPPAQPVCTCDTVPVWRVVTRRPVRPATDEERANPRARSARLRAALRLPEAA